MQPANWWVRAEWPVWRLVAVEQIATLREIDEVWSLSDVLDANEALDVAGEVQRLRDLARRSTSASAPQPKRRQGSAVARNTRPRPPARYRR